MTSVKSTSRIQQARPRSEEPRNTTTVKKGDKVEDVAKRLGVTVQELAQENPQFIGKKIKSGQELKIPPPTAVTPPDLSQVEASETTRAPARATMPRSQTVQPSQLDARLKTGRKPIGVSAQKPKVPTAVRAACACIPWLQDHLLGHHAMNGAPRG